MEKSGIHYIGMCKTMTDGDDALLRLAGRRFAQLGIGAEIYPSSPERFQELVPILPAGAVNTVHLPYGYNLLNPEHFEAMAACARIGGVRGFTLHDSQHYTANKDAFLDAARRLSDILKKSPGRPGVFVEFVQIDKNAELSAYQEKMAWLRKVPHFFPCVDAGHVAVQYCRDGLRERLPHLDQSALAPDYPELEKIIDTVQSVVEESLAKAISYFNGIFAMGWSKIHFHSHNIHPLSRFSPYPIRDHLSYLKQIPLPFSFRGKQFVDGVYGINGVRQLKACLLRGAKKCDVSLMFEIHRQPGRLPLGNDADLFAHWTDLTHAEEMNYHLELIAQCYNLFVNC